MARKQETEIRRKQIINAARKVIFKYGSEHVTVRKIAKEVGISEAALYRHFKSKKEILFLLAEYIEETLLKDFAVETKPEQSCLKKLELVLKSHLSSIEQRRGISFLVFAEIISLGDKKLNDKLAETLNKYLKSIETILNEGVKTGEIRSDLNIEAGAMIILGLVQGLVNLWAIQNYSFDLETKLVPLFETFSLAITKR